MGMNVAVVDYGVGNLFSVSRALEKVGATFVVTDSAVKIEAATHLILPGVGAFRDGMRGLQERKLVGPIERYGRSGRPFLGICLGMQMLFEWSEEFGRQEGLALMPGGVVAIPSTGVDGLRHKIPHIGWNELLVPAGRHGWEGTPLGNVKPGTSVYFVHSFTAAPSRPPDRLADCQYDGRVLSAAVCHANLFGCQFHPEKSGQAGLSILATFIQLA
jgi:imidazole glycerol-phosphate synthase subunit HisH